MGEGLGADVHRHHPACEFRWDLALQSRDERSELIQPHNPTPVRNAEFGVRNRRPPFHSAFRTPHSTLTLQALREVFGQPVGGEANLFQRVPVAHCHGAVLRGLTVDGDAERRAGLVLAAIAATDRAAVVVERVVVLPQIVEDAARQLGHPVLVHQREHRGFQWSDRGMQAQHHPLLSYNEEEVEGEKRVVLRLHPAIAPLEAAVFPLVNKDGMPELARRIFDDLRKHYNTFYDDGGSIGRRYRRQDEAGTPFGITIDGQSTQDGTVTVRDRDTLKQIRLAADRLAEYLAERLRS